MTRQQLGDWAIIGIIGLFSAVVLGNLVMRWWREHHIPYRIVKAEDTPPENPLPEIDWSGRPLYDSEGRELRVNDEDIWAYRFVCDSNECIVPHVRDKEGNLITVDWATRHGHWEDPRTWVCPELKIKVTF